MMASACRSPRVTGAFFAVAALSGIIGWGCFAFAEATSERTKIEMSHTSYEIPNIYLNEARSAGLNLRQKSFSLILLLPDLIPRTEQNKSRFDRVGWHDQIRISVEDGVKVLTPDEKFKNFVLNEHLDSASSSGPEGSRVYTSLKAMREYYVYGDAHTEHFLFCTLDKDSPYPYCSVTGNMADGSEISYSFSKNHLPSFRSIDENVNKLIRKFRVDAP